MTVLVVMKHVNPSILRLNSPVGVGGRWEADVDAGVDVLFTVLHCSMYCLQCGV